MFRLSRTRHLLKPPRLVTGDRIAVVSPAGPLDEKRLERLENGLVFLRQHGYTIVEGDFLRAQTGYLAGSDEQRARDVNEKMNDPGIKAIFCSRGGYGVTRLLDKIDYKAMQRNPKIIVGYSELTALSLALYRKSGLITFSGPMVATELYDPHPHTWESLEQILSGATPTFQADLGDNPWQIISPGHAEGKLLGGCLSVIVSLLGTPYCPSFENSILLLEDIGEDLYKIDRLFSQLKNAGILKKVKGIVLGQFVNILPDSMRNPIEFDDIISYYCTPLHIPVIGNFPYGHVPIKYTLPIGCRVHLDAEAGLLQLLEPAVI